MSKEPVRIYEGLFLFPHAAVADMQGAVDHISELLKRAGATILSLRKWDERRLAFEIKGNKRGLYFLVYFNAPTGKLVNLERDCNLSEKLLRALITRADHITKEMIETADGRRELADEIKLRATQPEITTAVPNDKEPEPAAVGAGDAEDFGDDDFDVRDE